MEDRRFQAAVTIAGTERGAQVRQGLWSWLILTATLVSQAHGPALSLRSQDAWLWGVLDGPCLTSPLHT